MPEQAGWAGLLTPTRQAPHQYVWAIGAYVGPELTCRELATIVRSNSSTPTMDSALLTSRLTVTANCSQAGCQDEIVDERDRGDHQEGQRNDHERDLLAVH